MQIDTQSRPKNPKNPKKKKKSFTYKNTALNSKVRVKVLSATQ